MANQIADIADADTRIRHRSIDSLRREIGITLFVPRSFIGAKKGAADMAGVNRHPPGNGPGFLAAVCWKARMHQFDQRVA